MKRVWVSSQCCVSEYPKYSLSELNESDTRGCGLCEKGFKIILYALVGDAVILPATPQT